MKLKLSDSLMRIFTLPPTKGIFGEEQRKSFTVLEITKIQISCQNFDEFFVTFLSIEVTDCILLHLSTRILALSHRILQT